MKMSRVLIAAGIIFSILLVFDVKGQDNLVQEIDKLTKFNGLKVKRKGKVQHLDLSNQGLNDLDGMISEFKNLRVLNLSHNHLSTLPKSLSLLQNLEFLNLSDNRFTEIPLEVLNLPNLKYLLINSNQIGTVPKAINKLKHLKVFMLCSNNLTDDDEKYLESQLPNCKVGVHCR
jgi:Leucine-rich repeat (LRR) protein